MPQIASNKIDCSLAPIPPFRSDGPIRLVIVGQDPTVRNVAQRGKIRCTLNLDREHGALRKYVDRICLGLDLSLENVYATNLFKYFYTAPPSDTPEVLAAHLRPNLELLKTELSEFEECAIITLGEPVLRLLAGAKQKVRNYWDYKGCGFHYIRAEENILNRRIFPLPHQPSMRKEFYKDKLQKYLRYMSSVVDADAVTQTMK